jgi:hypothetical protein
VDNPSVYIKKTLNLISSNNKSNANGWKDTLLTYLAPVVNEISLSTDKVRMELITRPTCSQQKIRSSEIFHKSICEEE